VLFAITANEQGLKQVENWYKPAGTAARFYFVVEAKK